MFRVNIKAALLKKRILAIFRSFVSDQKGLSSNRKFLLYIEKCTVFHPLNIRIKNKCFFFIQLLVYCAEEQQQ